MKLDDICDILLTKFNEIDQFCFNILILAIVEKKERIEYFYSYFLKFYQNEKTKAEEFLMKWIKTTPEVFSDPSQPERQLFPSLFQGFDQKQFFSHAKTLILEPFCNKKINIFDTFDLDINNMDKLIHDFEQNLKEVYGPYSANITGFSAKEVANCFFVIFSLLVNQRTLDCFIRNRMNEKDSYISIVHSTISNSICNEFERTLQRYMDNPNSNDVELMLIIKRFHSIVEECPKLHCEFLTDILSVPEKKPIFLSLVKRFKDHKYEEGIKAWEELPKIPDVKGTVSSMQFKERMLTTESEKTKNEMPPFVWMMPSGYHI